MNGLQKQSAKCAAKRNGLTPIVPGASEGKGRLCTPAASISFGVCASRSGSAWVKQAACKAVNSDRDFIIYGRRETDKRYIYNSIDRVVHRTSGLTK